MEASMSPVCFWSKGRTHALLWCIYGAPLAIIVCADHNKAWVRPFDQKQTGDIDTSICEAPGW